MKRYSNAADPEYLLNTAVQISVTIMPIDNSKKNIDHGLR